MDVGQHVRKQLAENIILLRSLNEVPGKEAECDLPAENRSRQLSIAREKQLGDDLAFLSATTDDMSRVMAVGIEEDEAGTGMTIRLASNAGDLSGIRGDFERIGVILQEAASRSRGFLSKSEHRLTVVSKRKSGDQTSLIGANCCYGLCSNFVETQVTTCQKIPQDSRETTIDYAFESRNQ